MSWVIIYILVLPFSWMFIVRRYQTRGHQPTMGCWNTGFSQMKWYDQLQTKSRRWIRCMNTACIQHKPGICVWLLMILSHFYHLSFLYIYIYIIYIYIYIYIISIIDSSLSASSLTLYPKNPSSPTSIPPGRSTLCRPVHHLHPAATIFRSFPGESPTRELWSHYGAIRLGPLHWRQTKRLSEQRPGLKKGCRTNWSCEILIYKRTGIQRKIKITTRIWNPYMIAEIEHAICEKKRLPSNIASSWHSQHCWLHQISPFLWGPWHMAAVQARRPLSQNVVERVVLWPWKQI